MKTYDKIHGWFNFDDLYVDIVNKYKNNKNVIFVEIGTWMGKSIIFLGNEVKKSNADIKIFGVDNFTGTPNKIEGEISKNEFDGNFYETFVQNIKDCEVDQFIIPIRKESLEAVNDFENESIDFIFIDGDHSYDAVLNDIVAWYPKLKSDGIICGHDLPQTTVKRALDMFCNARNLTYKGISKSCWMINK